MDLSKAFDALPLGLLLAKLRAYGVSIRACDLLKIYLSNRLQRVKIGNIKSDVLQIKRGVPQGCVTGLLLFNIFLNDLFFFLEGELKSVYNHADDNTCTLCHRSQDMMVIKQKLEKCFLYGYNMV